MKSKIIVLWGSAMLIFAAAGLAEPAWAQNGQAQTTMNSTDTSREPDFRSYRWLEDRRILNDQHEQVGVAHGFILDRGSGRIDYAVIKSGAVLGLGGKLVAVPYGVLRWDPTKEQFVVSMTTDDLKQYPTFSPEEWKGWSDPTGLGADGPADLRARLSNDAASTKSDPYSASLGDFKSARVEGEVLAVDRVNSDAADEQVMITVKTGVGESQLVAVGPSWYVNSGAYVPMRGDRVIVQGFTLSRDPQALVVAGTITSNSREMVLRSPNGAPKWGVGHAGADAAPAVPRRFLTLDTLKGAAVDCRGDECGKVNDLIIERGSGALVFLSIDPNQNFLGIGDTKRLVPWSVASISADGRVRIDASKDMVLASPPTPSDLTMLRTSGQADMVYRSYKVSAPSYRMANTQGDASQFVRDQWKKGGTVLGAIDRDSARTVNGTIVSTQIVELGKDVGSARAVTVDTGQDRVQVLLGPSWYEDYPHASLQKNESASIDVWRATINDTPYWIARMVECKGRKTVLIDTNKGPAWENR